MLWDHYGLVQGAHNTRANRYLQEDERIKKFVIFSMDSLQDLFGANAGAVSIVPYSALYSHNCVAADVADRLFVF